MTVRDGERRTVLFVNTATLPPLGADTWVHVQVMRALDRDVFEPVSAYTFGTRDEPTPTYRALLDVPDLELHEVNFGSELTGRGFVRLLSGSMGHAPSPGWPAWPCSCAGAVSA